MEEPEVTPLTRTVKKAALVHADPRGDAAPVAELAPGEVVVVLSHLGDLLKVRTSAGVEGYVVASAIEMPRPVVARAAPVAAFPPFQFSELMVSVSATLLVVSIFMVREFVWTDWGEELWGDRRYLFLIPAVLGIVSFVLALLRFGRLAPPIPLAVVQVLLGLIALGTVLLVIPLSILDLGLSGDEKLTDYLKDLPWGYLSASPLWGFALAFYGAIGVGTFGVLTLVTSIASSIRATASRAW